MDTDRIATENLLPPPQIPLRINLLIPEPEGLSHLPLDSCKIFHVLPQTVQIPVFCPFQIPELRLIGAVALLPVIAFSHFPVSLQFPVLIFILEIVRHHAADRFRQTQYQARGIIIGGQASQLFSRRHRKPDSPNPFQFKPVMLVCKHIMAYIRKHLLIRISLFQGKLHHILKHLVAKPAFVFDHNHDRKLLVLFEYVLL